MGAGLAGGTQWQAPSPLAVADQSRWACASASLQRCVDIIQGRGVLCLLTSSQRREGFRGDREGRGSIGCLNGFLAPAPRLYSYSLDGPGASIS